MALLMLAFVGNPCIRRMGPVFLIKFTLKRTISNAIFSMNYLWPFQEMSLLLETWVMVSEVQLHGGHRALRGLNHVEAPRVGTPTVGPSLTQLSPSQPQEWPNNPWVTRASGMESSQLRKCCGWWTPHPKCSSSRLLQRGDDLICSYKGRGCKIFDTSEKFLRW